MYKRQAYAPIANYFSSSLYPVHNYCSPGGDTFYGAEQSALVSGASYSTFVWPNVALTNGANGAQSHSGAWPDWENGVANAPDGPYVDRPDEGAATLTVANAPNSYLNAFVNLANGSYQLGTTFFSPNRQVSSPVMFGSLPTGVAHQYPWQTLLFRPGPGRRERR